MDDVRDVTYRARWRHAYARLKVRVDERSDVDALNALLCVADDVLERGGTHRARVQLPFLFSTHTLNSLSLSISNI